MIISFHKLFLPLQNWILIMKTHFSNEIYCGKFHDRFDRVVFTFLFQKWCMAEEIWESFYYQNRSSVTWGQKENYTMGSVKYDWLENLKVANGLIITLIHYHMGHIYLIIQKQRLRGCLPKLDQTGLNLQFLFKWGRP